MKNWQHFFAEEQKKPYFIELMRRVNEAYASGKVFPEKSAIFRAFDLTSYDNVKVVIFGQDPYHNGQATGLAFSVPNNDKLSKSLANIFSELENDMGIVRKNGDLCDWAKQGVLLLNTVLTVEAHQANSHKNIGWQEFIEHVIDYLNQKENIIYILWGKQAQRLKPLITNGTFIESAHPSPLSAYRGFFKSCPFSQVNDYLAKKNEQIVKW